MSSVAASQRFDQLQTWVFQQAAQQGERLVLLKDEPTTTQGDLAPLLRTQELSFESLLPLKWQRRVHLLFKGRAEVPTILPGTLERSAQLVMQVAYEKFLSDLQQRFECPESFYPQLQEMARSWIHVMAHAYKLHSEEACYQPEGLKLFNVQRFLFRAASEAQRVEALYFDTHELRDYTELTRQRVKPDYQPNVEAVKRLVNVVSDLAHSDRRSLILPRDSSDQLRNTYREAMSIEMVTTELTYQLPAIKNIEELKKLKVQVYNGKAGRAIDYSINPSIDLWSGLIAYHFKPQEPAYPHLLGIRGTQRRMDQPGFVGSMVSILHPKAPGAHVAHPSNLRQLCQQIPQDATSIILSGHSMGAEIATSLANHFPTSLQDRVERVYSFSNPGRNKHHMSASHGPSCHHFVGLFDPVAQLGNQRAGHTTVIFTGSKGRPQNMSDMLHQVASDLLVHHSRPLFNGHKHWMAVRVEPGQPIARYSFIWGFSYRLITHLFYGPIKMAVALAKAALLVLSILAPSLRNYYQHLQLRLRVRVENRDIPSRYHPLFASSCYTPQGVEAKAEVAPQSASGRELERKEVSLPKAKEEGAQHQATEKGQE